jgi:hypothetical protein
MHQLLKIASSDHFAILAKPTLGPNENNIETKKVKTRDMRGSNGRAFGRWMTTRTSPGVVAKSTITVYSAPYAYIGTNRTCSPAVELNFWTKNGSLIAANLFLLGGDAI